jgi:uncharacterized protein (TIGR02246 family)
MSLALGLLSLAVVAAAAPAAGDDVMPQAKAESKAFVKAFNEHNAKALGALCIETADFAFLQGSSFETLQFGLVSGRDGIINMLDTFFDVYPSSKLSHTVRRARLIMPDVMVSDEDFEITGLPTDAGPVKGQFVIIRVKTDGTWKIAAERNISKVPQQKS